MKMIPRRSRVRPPALLTALLLSLLLAACVSVGVPFRHEAVNQIKPGVTRDKDLLDLFGNPVRTGITDDGLREWTYLYYKAGVGGLHGQDLVVKFDEGGKVRSFSYHTTDPKEKIVQPK